MAGNKGTSTKGAPKGSGSSADMKTTGGAKAKGGTKQKPLGGKK